MLSYVTKVNLCPVSVSNYVPNTSLVPLNLPYIIETFCKYPWCSRWGVNSFVLCASVCLKWFFKKNWSNLQKLPWPAFRYLISLSGALAILNVVPCYALDGQFICHAFIELTLRSSFPDPEVRGCIFSIIIYFGTILLIINVIFAMWTLLVWWSIFASKDITSFFFNMKIDCWIEMFIYWCDGMYDLTPQVKECVCESVRMNKEQLWPLLLHIMQTFHLHVELRLSF